MSFIGKHSHLKLVTQRTRRSKSKLTYADRERMRREISAKMAQLSPREVADAAAQCYRDKDPSESPVRQAIARTLGVLLDARRGLPIGLGTIALANLHQRLKRENLL